MMMMMLLKNFYYLNTNCCCAVLCGFLSGAPRVISWPPQHRWRDGWSLPFPLCSSPLLSLTLAPPPLPNTTKMHQNAQIPPLLLRFLLIFSTLLSPFDPTTTHHCIPRHPPSPAPVAPLPPVKSKIPPNPAQQSRSPSVSPTLLLRIQRFCGPVALYLTICPVSSSSSFLYYLLPRSARDGENVNLEGQESCEERCPLAAALIDR